MTVSESARPTQCPACGAQASGRFCASCGGALDATACTACRAALAAGSSFCNRCGTPVGGARAPLPLNTSAGANDPRGLAATLPWVVAGIALLALIGLVAAQRLGDARSAGALAGQAGAPFASGVAPGARPPDLSQLSPREVAGRLFDRVMRLHGEGKADSVAFFAANMAIPAFQMLDTLDADARYDLGRIAEVSGAIPLARAQADAILGEHPNHLLGLVLAARVATASGNADARGEFERRLLAAEQAELAKRLPEYEAHRADIQNALSEARRRG